MEEAEANAINLDYITYMEALESEFENTFRWVSVAPMLGRHTRWHPNKPKMVHSFKA